MTINGAGLKIGQVKSNGLSTAELPPRHLWAAPAGQDSVTGKTAEHQKGRLPTYLRPQPAQPAILECEMQELIELLRKRDDALCREAADTIEALRKRLELSPDHAYDGIFCRDETIRILEQAISTLRARLEQPNTHRWNIERDGDALLVCEGLHEKHEACSYVRYVPQTEQEPIAWCDLRQWLDGRIWPSEAFSAAERDGWTPVYTSPPPQEQRPEPVAFRYKFGLTDTVVKICGDMTHMLAQCTIDEIGGSVKYGEVTWLYASPPPRPELSAAVAAEREACARLCESYAMPDLTSETAVLLAAAIRARGTNG